MVCSMSWDMRHWAIARRRHPLVVVFWLHNSCFLFLPHLPPASSYAHHGNMNMIMICRIITPQTFVILMTRCLVISKSKMLLVPCMIFISLSFEFCTKNDFCSNRRRQPSGSSLSSTGVPSLVTSPGEFVGFRLFFILTGGSKPGEFSVLPHTKPWRFRLTCSFTDYICCKCHRHFCVHLPF